MVIIGLTGSIGTGKSTVTRQFAQCGAATLDSDAVVHRLLEKDGAAVLPVAAVFPASEEQGGIDRKKLAAEVFGRPERLQQLEAIVHPLVRKAQDEFIRIQRARGVDLIVLDIPLLFETGGEKRCDYTVVTTAPLFVQRRRVLARPNMTQDRFLRILSTQMPDVEKRRRADFIIFTGAGKAASLRQVRRILLRLKKKNDSMNL